MRQYLQMLEHVITNGEQREDRTGTGTLSVFGYQNRYDLREGFPLMTTKKTSFRIIYEELMWFLRGETNIKPLIDKDVHIWTDDAYRWHKRNNPNSTLTMEEFSQAIKDGDWELGELGNIYGKQWRGIQVIEPDDYDLPTEIFRTFSIDQIQNVIDSIRKDPYSRRHIVCAWNVSDLDNMALPPCHTLFQFYVTGKGELSCQLYQRSADIFLGVPFNIASYALLTHMIASMTGLKVGEFVHTFGDLHLYKNHLPQAMTQLKRTPMEMPTLAIKRDLMRKEITDFNLDDFQLIGYNPFSSIPAKVSVGE